jgi:hypothetical protein
LSPCLVIKTIKYFKIFFVLLIQTYDNGKMIT